MQYAGKIQTTKRYNLNANFMMIGDTLINVDNVLSITPVMKDGVYKHEVLLIGGQKVWTGKFEDKDEAAIALSVESRYGVYD